MVDVLARGVARVSLAHAGVEACEPHHGLGDPGQPRVCGGRGARTSAPPAAHCQPRACGGGGELVAEAVTTRRRPVSVMVFLPERMYLDQVGGD